MEQRLKQALSVAIEALLTAASSSHEDPAARHALYEDTITTVRTLVGPDHRFTTMRVICAWCKNLIGEQEGNGAKGDSHGICPKCFGKQKPGVAA